MLSLKITIWAIIFVITNGAVFADYFKDNKILSALAGGLCHCLFLLSFWRYSRRYRTY